MDKWNDRKLLSEIEKDMNDKLILAGEIVKSKTQENIVSDGLVKTGKYRDSIDYEVDNEEQKVMIGTNVEYAPFLELGTKYIQPHFCLTNALRNSKKTLEKLFGKKLTFK